MICLKNDTIIMNSFPICKITVFIDLHVGRIILYNLDNSVLGSFVYTLEACNLALIFLLNIISAYKINTQVYLSIVTKQRTFFQSSFTLL